MVNFRHHLPQKDWLHYLVVFLILLTVYIWSMPRTVVLEDDGFFSLASYFNSVTHPPGYPLFIMLSHAFTWVPVGSIAFRVHLASAFFGTMSCLCVWYLVRCCTGEKVYAYIAALSLGFSRIFWSQAIIAEVYTLNVFLFLVLFILALHCITSQDKDINNYLKWFAFIYGLALSNHWPLILLSSPALLVLIWPVRIFLARNFIRYIPYLVIGLLPYLWLIWRSHIVPEYSFYGPIKTWNEFWFYLSRQQYESIDFSLTAGWYDKWQFAIFTLRETSTQLFMPAIVFVFIGIYRLWISRTGIFLYSIILAYLGNTGLIILARNVDYDLFNRVIFQVYPLISYLMIVICMVFGTRMFVEKVALFLPHLRSEKIISHALAMVIIIGTFLVNVNSNYRKNDFLAADYAFTILDSLEPGAIFYANADNIDGPVRYLREVEKTRKDVTAFNGRYIRSGKTLYRPYQLQPVELRKLNNRIINNTHAPVYYTNDFPNDYASYRYGFYEKVNRNLSSVNRDSIIVRPEFLSRLVSWKTRYKNMNAWNAMHLNLLQASFCDLILNVKYTDNAQYENELKPYEHDLCRNYQGLLQQLKYAMNTPAVPVGIIRELLDSADKKVGQAINKREQSELAYYEGLFYMRLNKQSRARKCLQKSVAIWPHPRNPSAKLLEELHH